MERSVPQCGIKKFVGTGSWSGRSYFGSVYNLKHWFGCNRGKEFGKGETVGIYFCALVYSFLSEKLQIWKTYEMDKCV